VTADARPGPHVLLIEDDGSTRSLVAANLEAHGYQVRVAGTAADAVRSLDAQRPDLVVLDLGLPDADGTTVIRRVRRDGTTPILILSARDEEPDKVAALELGADDYVTKPFGLEELRARVAALLRRAAGPAADTAGSITLGPLVLDVTRRDVRLGDVPVDLTPREYELLKVLMGQPGRLVTRGALLRAVWGRQYLDEDHYLHVYVSRLRRKLAAADPTGTMHDLITVEPGVGYRIREP
jgi:two-component system KDP operon response regulator KdpE